MKANDAFGEQPMQMNDYGMDERHYHSHRGDCSISATYEDDINEPLNDDKDGED